MSFIKTPGGFYVAKNATIVGDVVVGRDSSFWFNVVVRGDVVRVRIGQRTNIQDGAIIHCDHDIPNEIGNDVTIGHAAVVHGMEVGDGSLIGMSATVLGKTRIGRECLIAAGAVVPPGLVVPDGMLVMGVPGRVVRPVNPKELEYMRWLGKHYVNLAQRHAAGEFPPIPGTPAGEPTGEELG